MFDPHLLRGIANGVRYYREDKTESYVEIPPAYIITTSDGATWTLGFQYVQHNGEFEFNVLRNDIDTGEFAKRIVYRGGVLRIYGSNGWKTFSRSRRHFI